MKADFWADYTDWALPLAFDFGRYSFSLKFLCFELWIYWYGKNEYEPNVLTMDELNEYARDTMSFIAEEYARSVDTAEAIKFTWSPEEGLKRA